MSFAQNAREDVAASGRAARVEATAQIERQRELFLELDEIHEPALEHGARAFERELSDREFAQAILERRRTGKESGANAPCTRSEAQIEARGRDANRRG